MAQILNLLAQILNLLVKQSAFCRFLEFSQPGVELSAPSLVTCMTDVLLKFGEAKGHHTDHCKIIEGLQCLHAPPVSCLLARGRRRFASNLMLWRSIEIDPTGLVYHLCKVAGRCLSYSNRVELFVINTTLRLQDTDNPKGRGLCNNFS